MSVKFDVFHRLYSARLGAYRSTDGPSCEEKPQDHDPSYSLGGSCSTTRMRSGTEVIWDGPAFTRCDGGKRGRRRERLCYDAEGLKDAIKEREGIARVHPNAD